MTATLRDNVSRRLWRYTEAVLFQLVHGIRPWCMCLMHSHACLPLFSTTVCGTCLCRVCSLIHHVSLCIYHLKGRNPASSSRFVACSLGAKVYRRAIPEEMPRWVHGRACMRTAMVLTGALLAAASWTLAMLCGGPVVYTTGHTLD
eukprot:jgi/Ulvmu1/10354/UM061_0037.1